MSFTIKEAHEAALKFSQKTHDLFADLAENCHSSAERKIIKKQLKHEEKLIEKLKNVCKPEEGETNVNMELDLTAAAFLKMHLNRDPGEIRSRPVLATALELRKDSLLLFTELWSSCPYQQSRLMLQELIHEEKKLLLELFDKQHC